MKTQNFGTCEAVKVKEKWTNQLNSWIKNNMMEQK